MPNHITSVCRVEGPPAAVEAFVARHIVERTHDPDDGGIGMWFDLRTVIPQPECVEVTESGSEADAGFFALTGLISVRFRGFAGHTPMDNYTSVGFPVGPLTTPEQFREWLAENKPHVLEKGQASLRCFRETGHRDWYGWNVANWGTKWNAYDYEERFREPGVFVFKFETAWSAPVPVLDRLVGLHPELTFAVDAVDEGGPHFAGIFADKRREWSKVEETNERHRLCYGCDPEVYDDDEEGSKVSP